MMLQMMWAFFSISDNLPPWGISLPFKAYNIFSRPEGFPVIFIRTIVFSRTVYEILESDLPLTSTISKWGSAQQRDA